MSTTANTPTSAKTTEKQATADNKRLDKGFSKYNQIKIEEFWLYRVYDGKASDKDKWIDISYAHLELNIFEDIAVQTISAQLILSDPANLPDRFPIVGGERIRIKYKSTAEEESRELTFVVYKIGERLKTNDAAKNQTYVLFLCTEDRWLDSNLDISKSYSGTYDAIVKECLNELQTSRPLDVEESQTTCSFISPYWSPLRSVKFCAKRAVNSSASPFIFWETIVGYNFKSVSSIYSATPLKTIYIEPRLNKEHMQSMDKSLNTVLRFEFKESNNKLEQYAKGTYGSRVFYFNLDTKIVDLNEISYRNAFKDSVSHIEEFPLTDDMANVRKKNTFAMSMYDESHKSRYTRNMVLDHMSNYRVLIQLPGDTRINAGKIFNLDIPAMSNIVPGYQKEVLSSGRWMIASVRHRIGRETYDVHCEIVKDSHAVDIQESVYGKSTAEINEEDTKREEEIKRKETPTEVMGVPEPPPYPEIQPDLSSITATP